MSCISCGKCCESAQIAIIVTEDLAHYYSGFGVETFKDVDGNFVCRFKVDKPCINLRRDEVGKASCAIYENRPQMCRDYPQPHNKLFKGCGFEKR